MVSWLNVEASACARSSVEESSFTAIISVLVIARALSGVPDEARFALLWEAFASAGVKVKEITNSAKAGWVWEAFALSCVPVFVFSAFIGWSTQA